MSQDSRTECASFSSCAHAWTCCGILFENIGCKDRGDNTAVATRRLNAVFFLLIVTRTTPIERGTVCFHPQTYSVRCEVAGLSRGLYFVPDCRYIPYIFALVLLAAA